MAEQFEVNDAKLQTQKALFDEIKQQAETLKDKSGPGDLRARAIRDLALAYRYAAGGPQPGAAADK